MSNPLKARLAAGKPVVGTYVHEFQTPGIAPILAATGADFAIFDCEHSGHTPESLRATLLMARHAGLVPIVNTPGTGFEREGLFLDMGALGLMVPHVRDRAQAEALVAATRYPPEGKRGGAFGIAHDRYDARAIPATIANANESILIVAKLESETAIANAEAILSVPGIDVGLVTAYDLALDMGLGGDVGNRRIGEAMRHVLDLCGRLGKTAGCAAFDIDTGRKRLEEGYRFIQYSWDVGLVQAGLKAGVSALRSD